MRENKIQTYLKSCLCTSVIPVRQQNSGMSLISKGGASLGWLICGLRLMIIGWPGSLTSIPYWFFTYLRKVILPLGVSKESSGLESQSMSSIL